MGGCFVTSQDRERVDQLRQTIDLLIVDDVQEWITAKGTQDTFFHVFNHLFRNGKRIVKRAMKVDDHPLTVDDILETVCNHFGVTTAAVGSKSRKRELVTARQVSMYLAQKYTKMPAARIGKLVGGRDHSTVLHSCTQVEQRLKTDSAFSAEVSSIENAFKLKKA